MSGSLILVATPIGNLGDLAPRAVEVLASADIIACEDTRRTGRLLEHAGVVGYRLTVVNEQTEESAAVKLADAVVSGSTVALVTDAGMPAISDPGLVLVRRVVERGGVVSVVPGPSAVDAALVMSGFATDRFCFDGFLPRRGSARAERIHELVHERRTTVLYESPHRVIDTLAELEQKLSGDRQVAVVREISKLHEQIWRGPLRDAAEATGTPRGEYVLVVEGSPAPLPPNDNELSTAIEAHREAGLSTRDAVDAVAALFEVPRKRVYSLATR